MQCDATPGCRNWFVKSCAEAVLIPQPRSGSTFTSRLAWQISGKAPLRRPLIRLDLRCLDTLCSVALRPSSGPASRGASDSESLTLRRLTGRPTLPVTHRLALVVLVGHTSTVTCTHWHCQWQAVTGTGTPPQTRRRPLALATGSAILPMPAAASAGQSQPANGRPLAGGGQAFTPVVILCCKISSESGLRVALQSRSEVLCPSFNGRAGC